MIVVCQLDKKGQSIISTNILLNPEIIEKSDKIILQEEACLSLPGME
jgi:peptide deformylase